MQIDFILDEDGQEFVFENEWDTVIPVSFEMVGDTLSVTVFPEIEAEMRTHFEKYDKNPFEKSALEALWATLAPYMQKWGYADDKFRDRWGYILSAAPSATSAVTPLPTTRKLEAKDEDMNQTTFDIEYSIEANLLGFGTEEQGKIVSLAMTHSPLEEEPTTIEVGVETIPSARRKGYAASNLAALVSALGKLGHTTEYRCQRYNHASRKTALKVGMKEIGKYYYYVGRKI